MKGDRVFKIIVVTLLCAVVWLLLAIYLDMPRYEHVPVKDEIKAQST